METNIVEIWRPVKSYEGKYEVSNLGSVKSITRKSITGKRVNGKIMNKTYHPQGYIRIELNSSISVRDRKSYYVHRLVADAFIDNPFGKSFVNHIDGNKENNNVENLEWVTKSENAKHAVKMGLVKSPSLKGWLVKDGTLRDEQVLTIFNSDKNRNELANEYGVSPRTIYNIKRGLKWTRVTGKKAIQTKGITH